MLLSYCRSLRREARLQHNKNMSAVCGEHEQISNTERVTSPKVTGKASQPVRQSWCYVVLSGVVLPPPQYNEGEKNFTSVHIIYEGLFISNCGVMHVELFTGRSV